jgi:hypothetical protein
MQAHEPGQRPKASRVLNPPLQLAKWEKEIGADREMVKSQYEQKGYVEYEVDVDLFPARAPPRPGRRRARHGVVAKKKPQGGGGGGGATAN